MRNAAGLKETLLKKYSTAKVIPPIIILYMDEGPEQCTNFLSVKTAITVLYHSLKVNMILDL